MTPIKRFRDWLNRNSKASHRTTAMNCRFWIGDNGFADRGTCAACPDEPRP